MRHEKDEWDIVSSVGLTALGVAGGRAIESTRPDALIVDPYAGVLVDAAGAQVPVPTRLPYPGYEDDPQFGQVWSLMAAGMGLRSRFFDEFFAAGWENGVTQAVILASGLDARAWRLDWPADARVFEIDQPRVLAFKDEVLAGEGAEPRCTRHPIAIDLREDWPAALREAGFDPSRPTAWLAEGLLPYLPEDAEARLLAAVHELSAPGSRVAVEHARALGANLKSGDNWSEHLADQFGVDITELFYDNENRPDPDERLAGWGWRTTVSTGREVAARYGRALDGLPAQLTDMQRFVTAYR